MRGAAKSHEGVAGLFRNLSAVLAGARIEWRDKVKLRPYLDDAFALAGEDGLDLTAKVFPRLTAETNLRTQLERILKRLQINPWPKLFQNLRASCETELLKTYPIHVVATWMGHSPKVALQHYAQVTDADFAKAAGVAPNPTRALDELGCTRGAGGKSPYEKGRDFDIPANSVTNPVSLSGLEPETYGLKVRCSTD
jgi:hypothetical protein